MMVEGSVDCPQCGHCNFVDTFHHTAGSDRRECEDCGCIFTYDYEVTMETSNVEIKERGTNWDEDD